MPTTDDIRYVKRMAFEVGDVLLVRICRDALRNESNALRCVAWVLSRVVREAP